MLSNDQMLCEEHCKFTIHLRRDVRLQPDNIEPGLSDIDFENFLKKIGNSVSGGERSLLFE